MSSTKISALTAASTIDATADYLPIVTNSISTTQKINRNTLLGITGSPVGNSDSQTLTNKTITAPTISSPVLSGTITGTYTIGGTPTFPSSVATLADVQTLTNKTLTAPTITSPNITGTVAGAATYSTPTLTVPVIADFTSATHNHTNNAGGGTLKITSGGASTGLIDQSGLALDIEARANTTFAYFVESGLVWTAGAGLLGNMTSGFVWINGRRITVSSVSNHSFTANKDTYIDVDTNGALTYTEVANNAASPALAANQIRVAIQPAGAIAVGAFNQGSPAAALPTVSSNILAVCDSLGNMIYNTSPKPTMIGYRQITSDFTTSSTSYVDLTGLLCPVIIPTGRLVTAKAFAGGVFSSVNGDGFGMAILDSTASVEIVETNGLFTSGNADTLYAEVPYLPPAAGARTFKCQFRAVVGGTAHTNSSSTLPTFIRVDLI